MTTASTSTRHVADLLLRRVREMAAPVCVGLDPVLARVPASLRASGEPDIAVIRAFSMGVLDAVAGIVPCVKLQSACYERYGAAGSGVLTELIDAARDRGLEVILDAKRGDIGISASHYAFAALGSEAERKADWVTVNPYLGEDGIVPFLEPGGAFALVRTSNPGGDALQTQRLASGDTVAEHVASLVHTWGLASIGAEGYSLLGAVVGATKREDIVELRRRMPHQVFLVPGYGAQGARADDVRACFDAQGLGAVVTASRSVIYADANEGRWTDAVHEAAKRLADEVGAVARLR